jgi:hypothetical protein
MQLRNTSTRTLILRDALDNKYVVPGNSDLTVSDKLWTDTTFRRWLHGRMRDIEVASDTFIIYKGAFNFNNIANPNLLSQVIPGNTLGTVGGVLVTIEAGVTANAANTTIPKITFGGTDMWGNSLGTITTSANTRGLYWQFLLANQGATNDQRLVGRFSLTSLTAGSVAGFGSNAAADLIAFGFTGTAAKDTTLDQTLVINWGWAQNVSLTIKGTVFAEVLK